MASFVRHPSPFVETEPPPPPVVLLLSQTDLNTPTSTGLVIHEDLELVPSAKKTVVFAPGSTLEYTYPPPPIFTVQIPIPPGLTRDIIENHKTWEGEVSWEDRVKLTAAIKAAVHALVEQFLDTTKVFSDQRKVPVEEVYRQAAQKYPILGKYEDNWLVRCIATARLKSTSAHAKTLATKEAVIDVKEATVRP
ncbi:hypothetical protein B0H10DRAFT_1968038 [Mycena sp. CBHHK59/15]|nr:hypothetical protein B0H10DRAFT_1968038 [Mycena sp. CBHHK59/15]